MPADYFGKKSRTKNEKRIIDIVQTTPHKKEQNGNSPSDSLSLS